MIYDEMFFEEINTVLNATIEGVLLIDNGFIANVNDPFIKSLGYKSKDDLIGNLATGCLMPSSAEKYIEFNKTKFQEVILLSKDGELIPAIIKITDITLKSKLFKMVSVLDLTELKEKETLLLKQSRMAAMGEMISMIAHQWRQPLAAISSATASMKLKIAMNKADLKLFDKKIDEVGTYLQYMSKTIDDFRDFFKNDKRKCHFYLNELVDLSIKMILPALQTHGIDVTIQKKELSKIFLYENELVQVILNILNNAKDALVDNKISKPYIDIQFEEKEQCQIVTISDNAGGIPDHIINHIFEPYFSTKENKNGTGLGLYMCKIIIEKHCNGQILVNNTQEGCCFTIILNN